MHADDIQYLFSLIIVQNDWSNLEEPYGSIFLSIPTVLDPSLAPEGNHILHIFTTSSIEDWQVFIHILCMGVAFLHIFPFSVHLAMDFCNICK